MNQFKKEFLLGIGFNNLTMQEVLEYIIEDIGKNTKKYYVVTPNPEILVIAYKNKKYKKVLNNAELALPDGIGVSLASKLLDKPIKERIPGVDLVENLCRAVSKRPITVGFLGGGPYVADRTAECLKKNYPGLKVSYISEEWNFHLKNPQIDILFVAFGSPKQEIWLNDNLEKLPVKVAVGVGGSFDFISGKVKRAPFFVRNAGFEWLFRLMLQPWRIKRQIKLIYFVYLVFLERLRTL